MSVLQSFSPDDNRSLVFLRTNVDADESSYLAQGGYSAGAFAFALCERSDTSATSY